jgi:tetratricopeptide (TPR) repeat protein
MGTFIEPQPSTTARTRARTDARGVPIGTSSPAAQAHAERALESLLSYFGDPLQALDAAAAEDPGWAYPLTLKAAVLLTLAEQGPAAEARGLLDQAAPLLAHAPERERAHHEAARAAAAGDWDTACRRWDAILVRWPRDAAALVLAHLFDFYRGDALNLQRRPQRVLPQWTPDLPLYGYVLGMLAFGQEESGDYAQAEDSGRAALEANRRDPWAVHAVTHVFEMQGRHREGAQWLTTRHDDWAVDNGFAFHNWFHAALFQLESMDTTGALATYDAHLADATEMALQRVDGTAVLWRLKLLGVDVGDRFAALRATWDPRPPASGFYTFNDVHALLAQLGSGDAAGPACVDLLGALESPAAGGPTNRRMAAEIGLPLAKALLAYGRRDHADAAQRLFEVRDRANGFGGSHAQRDLLTLTLLDAAVRAGEVELARHVLNERRPAKNGTGLTRYWEERIGAAA